MSATYPHTSFGPIGDSQKITLTQASARWALSTLAASGPAIMLIGLSGAQGAWYVKFGSVTVTVSVTDGMRLVPGSVAAPAIIPVPAGATHVAIICDGSTGDAILSCGGMLFGDFSPLGDGSQTAITSTDQRITLPALGTPNPAIRLVGMQGQMGALWLKLGNSGVTGSLTTSHKYLPGSAADATVIPVTNGETHLSIFCEGAGGNVLLHGGSVYTGGESRERLTANRTYYVRTDGSDNNTGLVDSAAGAFLTIDRARQAAYSLDLAGFAVTVQIRDGTYTAGTACVEMPPGATAGTPITFQGNAGTPGNVIVSVTSANAFSAQNGAFIYIKDMELRTTTAGSCLIATRGGQITYGNIRFGTCAGFHKEASDHGRFYNQGNYSIVGGAVAHEHAPNLGYILNLSCTVTLTGTPAFSAFYIGAALCGCAQYVAVTFSGAATGQRYLAHKNAVIDSNAGGPNFFPGNVAGATATGGQYI